MLDMTTLDIAKDRTSIEQLTNSLEEHHEQTGSLFASYLANESKEADRVKKVLFA